MNKNYVYRIIWTHLHVSVTAFSNNQQLSDVKFEWCKYGLPAGFVNVYS
jgi:hypothetical protein